MPLPSSKPIKDSGCLQSNSELLPMGAVGHVLPNFLFHHLPLYSTLHLALPDYSPVPEHHASPLLRWIHSPVHLSFKGSSGAQAPDTVFPSLMSESIIPFPMVLPKTTVSPCVIFIALICSFIKLVIYMVACSPGS